MSNNTCTDQPRDNQSPPEGDKPFVIAENKESELFLLEQALPDSAFIDDHGHVLPELKRGESYTLTPEEYEDELRGGIQINCLFKRKDGFEAIEVTNAFYAIFKVMQNLNLDYNEMLSFLNTLIVNLALFRTGERCAIQPFRTNMLREPLKPGRWFIPNKPAPPSKDET